MATDPETQVELDGLKQDIANEGNEIATKVDEVIAAVKAGQSNTETIAQLRDIRASVQGLSDRVVLPSTGTGGTGGEGGGTPPVTG